MCSATIGDAAVPASSRLGRQLCVDGVQLGRRLRGGGACAQPAEQHHQSDALPVLE